MRTRTEECNTWSLCCSRCAPPSWLSRVLKRMTLSPTRGRIHWRHGGDYRRDTIRQQEEDETFCARLFLLDDALFCNSKRVSNAASPTCLDTRSLLPWSHWCQSELEIKHLILQLESLVPEDIRETSAPGSRDVRWRRSSA